MSESINRVNYYKGQFLRTDDFQDEQDYHIKMRYRHNIAHHQWGIVAGLEIDIDNDDGLPYLKPGMAIDGFGRELIVVETRPLPTNRFDLELSETLDVWLYFRLTNGSQNSGPANGCNPQGAGAFNRRQENPQLWLEDPLDEPANRREPPLVNPEQFDFAPYMLIPDADDQIWPVFLGQISRDASQSPPVYSCNLDHRPYVGALAALIESPTDKTRLQLGSTGMDDSQRLALILPGEENEPYLKLYTATEESGDVKNKWLLRGHTTIVDTLTMDKGALQFEAGAACPQEGLPWTIYQCEGAEEGEEGAQDFKALRLELPDGAAGMNRFAVGFWSPDEGEDGGFKSIFSLADDGQIMVNGNLHVNGKATVTDPGFSDEAQAQIKSAFTGSTSRVGLIGVLNSFTGPMGATFAMQSPPGMPGTMGLLANSLMGAITADPQSVNFFYSLLDNLVHPFFKILELGPPLDAAEIEVTQPFNDPVDYYNLLHEGTDYTAAEPVNVICMYPGKVISTIESTTGYGKHVIIESVHKETGIPFSILYGHLEEIEVSTDPSSADVGLKDIIGLMGSTGNSTAPHVHINLMVPSLVPKGNYAADHVVNPHPFVLRGNKGQVTYT
ncbi:MAG: M23 family metallopeptidase [Candidatus Promineifilaceae bacterium]|nr:M23 family metallopeptidase [Candidatus Promineifilaceae bacterium]